MKCLLLASTKTGQITRATVYFRDGEVTAEPATAADAVFVKNLLDTSHAGQGKKIVLSEDPRGWFESLPRQYNGTYLRAQIVKDDAQKQEVTFDKITLPA
jgi:hypothetical protein